MLAVRSTTNQRGTARDETIYLIGEFRKRDYDHTLGSPGGMPAALAITLGSLILIGGLGCASLLIAALVVLLNGAAMAALWLALGGLGSFGTAAGLLQVGNTINQRLEGADLYEDRTACVQSKTHISYTILFENSRREGWPTEAQMKEIQYALRSNNELGRDLKSIYDMYFCDPNVVDLERQLLEYKSSLDQETGRKLYRLIRSYAVIFHKQALATLKSHEDLKSASAQAVIDRTHMHTLSLIDRAEADLQGRTAVPTA